MASRLRKAEEGRTNPDYRVLHDAADGARPKVQAAIRRGLENIRSRAAADEVAKAIRENRPDDVLNLLGLSDPDRGIIRSDMEEALAELRRLFEVSAKAAAGTFPSSAEMSFSFDLLNPHSVEFLRTYEFELVQGISNVTRDGIRSAMLDAFERGVPPDRLAAQIATVVGLTPVAAKGIADYRQLLEDEGIGGRRLNELVANMTARRLRQRAAIIARTETIRAANGGVQEGWYQAVEDGFIDPDTARRFWIITPDDRLCPVCATIPDMNPEGRRVDEPFTTDVGDVMFPPAHPQCRCAVSLEDHEL